MSSLITKHSYAELGQKQEGDIKIVQDYQMQKMNRIQIMKSRQMQGFILFLLIMSHCYSATSADGLQRAMPPMLIRHPSSSLTLPNQKVYTSFNPILSAVPLSSAKNRSNRALRSINTLRNTLQMPRGGATEKTNRNNNDHNHDDDDDDDDIEKKNIDSDYGGTTTLTVNNHKKRTKAKQRNLNNNKNKWKRQITPKIKDSSYSDSESSTNDNDDEVTQDSFSTKDNARRMNIPTDDILNKQALQTMTTISSTTETHSNNNNDRNLPTIQAILIPRQISIPRILRLIACFIFTSSLLESMRTSGKPYQNAILAILHQNGIPITSSSTTTPTTSAYVKLSPLDEYIAKKLTKILPPRYMPSPIPLLGLFLSLFLHIGVTMLFPKWFVNFYVWLNYHRLDIHNDDNNNKNNNGHGSMKKSLMIREKKWMEQLAYKFQSPHNVKNKNNNDEQEVDYYYSSQFTNPMLKSMYNTNSTDIGIALLVHLSKQDQEMSNVVSSKGKKGTANVVQWIHSSEDQDQPFDFFIEVNQRRVYIDPTIPPPSSSSSSSLQSSERQLHIECHDGGPTFFQTKSLANLLQDKNIRKGLSNPKIFQTAQNRYGPYCNLDLPTPTVQAAFLSRISSPLTIFQLLGRIMTMLEESFIPACLNLLLTVGHHYLNAKKSIVTAVELAEEVRGNVESEGEVMVWVLRPYSDHGMENSSKKKKKETKMSKKEKKRRQQKLKKNKKEGKWVKIPMVELLPGDVFRLDFSCGRAKSISMDTSKVNENSNLHNGFMMPVDALILEGSCVAQEAFITGESVPQVKVPIELDGIRANDDDGSSEDTQSSKKLSIDDEHRSSVLFAGTSVSYTEPAKCLVLRSGSYSSKGEIVRALCKSRGHVGSISSPQSERDSLLLISVLSGFAVIACASLFLPGNEEYRKKTSSFRRVIQCTRIAVASIPSDLPMALSSMTHQCAANLRKDADVVCSEPGSLLTASQVEMIVFDKTGTLTADTQSVKMIVPSASGLSTKKKQSKAKSKRKEMMHPMTNAILAGCHSLAAVDTGSDSLMQKLLTSKKQKLVGDPIDLAALAYSNWNYDGRTKSASILSASKELDKAVNSLEAKKLWQIKSFPFDPNRRQSSALLLVLHRDDILRLWKVVKGSPDGMLESFPSLGEESGKKRYTKTLQKLERKGIRVLAMGTEDISQGPIATELFPGGIPDYKDIKDGFDLENIRSRAQKVHRNAIENESLDFAGFLCFQAAIRPSSARVISSMDIPMLMLTGDGLDAAFAVGEQVNLFDEIPRLKKAAYLDIQNDELIWTVKHWKKTSSKKNQEINEEEVDFSLQTSQGLFRERRKGTCVVLATGRAIEYILSKIESEEVNEISRTSKFILQNLAYISVIARSSPQTKQRVISALKRYFSYNVMMCGDGVNDIAAMKTADVSFALLNGFDDDLVYLEKGIDMENERRKERFFNRFHKGTQAGENTEKKFGDPQKIDQMRLRKKIESALLQAQVDSGNDSTHDFPPILGLGTTIKSVINVLKEERQRSITLAKGGAGAARILARDDEERKAFLEKKGSMDDATFGESPHAMDVEKEIKPGEASLAAEFTCLRPCIDGVDTVIRTGIATSAFSLYVYRTIALSSLMACYNLATLYRDGFRYGKYMWNIEITLLTALDRNGYNIGSIPRPTISNIRPHDSIFHPASALSIVLQAMIHLVTLTMGVKYANLMEKKNSLPATQGIKIRLADTGNNPLSQTKSKLGPLISPSSNNSINKRQGIFGRKPFHPNFVTNTVFLLSIFQNVVITTTNHVGIPFHGSILESRSFCVTISLSVLFCVAAITELFPTINNMLELAPMPSKVDKIFMLILFAFDFLGSYGAENLCYFFLDKNLWLEKRQYSKKVFRNNDGSAVSVEEDELSRERTRNRILLLRVGLLSLYLIARMLKKS